MSGNAAKVLRAAIHEAVMIFVAATILGFAYTALTKKGIFVVRAPEQTVVTTDADLSPQIIRIEEALVLYVSGTAVFIDTRSEPEYSAGHIKGAVNIPLSELDEKRESIKNLPGDKTPIVYCDGSQCGSSIEFADRLYSGGVSNVKIFFGGWEEWRSLQLPVETSTP